MRVARERKREFRFAHPLFDIRGEMVSVEDQYYDLNWKLLTIMGLCPYQKLRFRIVIVTLFLVILLSFFIAQLATFVTSEFNMNLVLKVLSQAFPCLVYIMKYNSFLMNGEKIKILYERIHDEWITVKAPDEIDILKKYAGLSRLFSLTITVLVVLFIVIFSLYQFVPDFLDIVAPLNESRKRHITFLAEYFVDQRRYFYLIVTHGLLAVTVGGVGTVAAGASLMTYVLHICAMLKIASHRLEHMTDNVPLISSSEKDHVVRKRIINAVDIHRRALEYADFLLACFANFYFVLSGVGIASLTINMFQLLQLVMFTNDTNGALACAILVFCHLNYLLLANLAGQIVTDHNSDIFDTTYAAQWYAISVHAQKLLLLILQKNTKNYNVVIGGIFIASLQGFASMISMSISYFTVIYSTR